MNSNQQAYDTAFQRAVDGKSPRSLWGRLMSSLFEDEYTRQSRLKGERDGVAAREASGDGSPGEAQPVA